MSSKVYGASLKFQSDLKECGWTLGSLVTAQSNSGEQVGRVSGDERKNPPLERIREKFMVF